MTDGDVATDGEAREPRAVVGPAVLAALFPDPPPDDRRGRTAVRDALLFAAAIALTLVAAHGSLLGRIWAEDGSRVLTGAYQDPWTAVGEPFHGYLNVFPRLGGLLATAFPVRDAALVLAVVSAVSISAVAVFVLHACAAHVRLPVLRWLLVAATLVLPVSAFEMLDNTVNVHWWLTWGAFWALMWRPQRLPGLVAGCLLCLFAPLSDPLAVFLLPIAALRLVLVRERRQQLITGCYLVATVIQLASSSRQPAPAGALRPSSGEIGRAVAARIVIPLFAGNRLTDTLWRAHQWPAIVIASALVLAAVIVALLRWRSRRAALTVCCLLLAAACAVAPFVLRPGEIRLPLAHRTLLFLSGRYSWLPILFLLTVVVLAIDIPPGQRKRARTASLAVVTAVFVTFFATIWGIDYWYVRGPASHHVDSNWKASIEAATRVCATGQEYVLVRVTPPGFAVRVPCARLR